jgi:rRNA maturation protein Nop10
MPLMFKCPKCKTYSLDEKCKCGEKTESPQYKFRPKWAKSQLMSP